MPSMVGISGAKKNDRKLSSFELRNRLRAGAHTDELVVFRFEHGFECDEVTPAIVDENRVLTQMAAGVATSREDSSESRKSVWPPT